MTIKKHQIPLQIKSFSEQGLISGYASVFKIIDHHNDYIKAGAFSDSIARKTLKDIKFLWQHKNDEPIGFITKLYEDQYGLYIEVQLLLELNKAKEAYELLKAKIVTGLSIGFNIEESYIDQPQAVRVINKIDLLEVSLVTFPANQQALITDVKEVDELKQLNSQLLAALKILKYKV